TLFIGSMHFMDLYNMDLERIKRCGVHYATPDGKIIPFCTYNTIHREQVEKKFSTPLLRVRTS
ncbi:MAG: radical SAM protein, partial [Candidatus Methanoperedens sp.]|nr:radical SAM protein [Candidatus Methanoperedens sp.]